MSKFEIVIWETVRHAVVVEADDRQEAITKGFNIIATGVAGVDYQTTSSGSKTVDANQITKE